MCPTSSSCAERDVRFWNVNKPCCFALLPRSGRGCLSVTHLVARSDALNIADATANVCVLCVCACPTHLEAVGATSPRRNDVLRSAALISASGALYPPPYSNEMGGMAGPRMSQQDGNQCMLIKATNLQTTTSKRLCHFSLFSPRAILTTKKDLRRLSYTPRWVLSL